MDTLGLRVRQMKVGRIKEYEREKEVGRVGRKVGERWKYIANRVVQSSFYLAGQQGQQLSWQTKLP